MSTSPPRKRNRPSGFDVKPVEGLPGTTPSIPGQSEKMSWADQPASRRVYVDGIPASATEQSLVEFFNSSMAQIEGTTEEGDAVVNVVINLDMKSALVDFRSAQEASNAMALDGIRLEDKRLRISRPEDYNHPAAGSSDVPISKPSKGLDLRPVQLALLSEREPGEIIQQSEVKPTAETQPHQTSRVLCLTGLIIEDEDYELMKRYITNEAERFGCNPVEVIIPRSGPKIEKVLLQYSDIKTSSIARARLNGMKFGTNQVVNAEFHLEEDLEQLELPPTAEVQMV